MKKSVIFVWANFGPYHVDRLEAAALALENTHEVVGIEIAGTTDVYPWMRTEKISGFRRITLFPDLQFEAVSEWRQLSALVRACLKLRARKIFLCHYERWGTHILAWLLRLAGSSVYLMIESKFDDKPRYLEYELAKKAFFLPYRGALVGGHRSLDYLRFFGFDPKKIHFGYDTVSMERVRRLAGSPPAPAGVAFANRHFTIVARLVPKKNISMALDAYARYSQLAGPDARALHICGSGELEDELLKQVRDLGVENVVFHGFVQAPEIARILSSTLALILPSVQEQWGLVINEALAMGLPILCSLNVGARDRLVNTGVNGYVFEPDNPLGLARIMHRLAEDESEWRQFAEESSRLAPLADTAQFGGSVARIVLGEPADAQSCERSAEKASPMPFRATFAPGGEVKSMATAEAVWPTFFLVGAPKAGTTAIAEALEQHPDIYSAPVKEPNFFNPDIWVEDLLPRPKVNGGRVSEKQFYAVIRDERTYLSLYQDAGSFKAIGDYSVNYLRSSLAPRRIHEKIGNAKIIIVLRNPTDRAFSHFLMDRSIGRVNSSFRSVIEKHIPEFRKSDLSYDNYIQCGMYADNLENYIEVFGRDNVFVLLYDDLIGDFEGTVKTILRHIGVSTDISHPRIGISNPSKIPKLETINAWLYKTGLKGLIIKHFPRLVKDFGISLYYERAPTFGIEESDRARLLEVHRADLRRVEKIIGRDLGRWLQ